MTTLIIPTVIILSFVILIAASYLQSKVFAYLGSLMFMLTGIYVMIYGMLGEISWLSRGLAFILLGIGLYVSILSSYSMIDGGID